MKENPRAPVWQRYVMAVVAVTAMTAFRWVVQALAGTTIPMSTLYFAVIAAAWWGGLGPGLLAVALSVVATNVFFISDFGKFNMPLLFQWVLMGIFIYVNVLVCLMVEALHRARQSAETYAREIQEKHDAFAKQRQAELAQAEAEERSHLAAEISDLGTWDSNPDTGEVRWSSRLREILGVPVDVEVQEEIGWTLIHPEDRPELEQQIAAARDPTGPGIFASEHRILRPDGTVRWVQMRGLVLFTGEGSERRPVRDIGAVLDITERKGMEARMQRREEAVLALATTQPPSLEERIRQVTEAAAGALDVERVSVWLFTADRLGIQCEDLYTRSQRKHERGGRLSGSRYPSYFAALARGAPILADDAHTHDATAELWESYLKALGVSSMLDVPIRVGGRHAGVICHEHTGPARHWSADDQEFAASLATTVALALEAEQRRRAEEALTAAEERLRLAAKAGGVGIFDVNFKTGEYWSPEMNTIFGFPSEAEVSFKLISSLIHPEDRKRVSEETEWALTPGGPGHFETVYRVLRPDGAIRWVRVNGRADFAGDGAKRRVARVLGTAQDITALKEAEEAARESGEDFRTLANNIPQLAWMTNERGWTFWNNQRWLDFARMTQEEMQGWRWLEFVHPAHVVRVTEKFRHHIARGEVWEDTYPLRDLDGNYRWFLSRAIPIRDAQGRVLRWFGTNTDVTEQRKREEDLREVDRHKSEFLAMLGHELRNPLAAIRNALVLCQVENESFDWAKGVVDRQSAQLARLVDDLMDVSRITQGKVELRRERVDLCEAVTRAVEATRLLIVQRGHELSVDCPAGALWVDADPARLQQILGNLLSNAAKYTESGGKISVTATVDDVPSFRPEMDEKKAEFSREVTITVRDSGVGIPPEKLPQMFEIFAQAERSLDRAEGGLGLGLTIVKMLTEMHGGRVNAWSAGLGKGSTFSIHLPAAPAPAAGQVTKVDEPGHVAAATSVAPPRPIAPKEQRVLVVDDNADAAEALCRLLRRVGCKLEIAHDGPSALDRAHEFHPTAVLLDIGLPGMDGYEVARRLRAEEHEEHALLVAITGYGQEDDLRRSREAGFDRHLIKPVNIDEIEQLLEKLG